MFFDWLAKAEHNDTYEYARGDLANMRWQRVIHRKRDKLIPDEINQACDAAEDAYAAYERGDVDLVQRRLGSHEYSYIAIRKGEVK